MMSAPLEICLDHRGCSETQPNCTASACPLHSTELLIHQQFDQSVLSKHIYMMSQSHADHPAAMLLSANDATGPLPSNKWQQGDTTLDTGQQLLESLPNHLQLQKGMPHFTTITLAVPISPLVGCRVD
jgi:hypothetical protein